MISIFLFLHATYYCNVFILYRHLCNIQTKPNEDIDRVLSFNESLDMLYYLFNNLI